MPSRGPIRIQLAPKRQPAGTARAPRRKANEQTTTNMNNTIILPLLAALSTAGCKTALPPADDEILDSFEKHEAAFNRIYDIVAYNSVGSFHYPPLYQYETALADSAIHLTARTKKPTRPFTDCQHPTGRCSTHCWPRQVAVSYSSTATGHIRQVPKTSVSRCSITAMEP